jgi:hypothetical protein
MSCVSSVNLTICCPGPWDKIVTRCHWCGKDTIHLVAAVHGGWCGFDDICGECGIYSTGDEGPDCRPIFEDSEEGQARKRRIVQVSAHPGPIVNMSEVIRQTFGEEAVR